MFILNKNLEISFKNWCDEIEERGSAVLINKDRKWTSFDVIAKLRNILQIKKLGHCGTLDPFATGLLIVCIGRKATREIYKFQELKKEYITTIKIGATTKSFDIENEEENISDISNISNKDIEDSIYSFVGKIKQIPPMFSAKKIKGKRMYELARKNIEVEHEPIEVNIYKMDIIDINLPYVKLLVECSKGTYIRAIARDIGIKLNTGAYLTELERTAIGDYRVENAFSIQELINYKNKEN